MPPPIGKCLLRFGSIVNFLLILLGKHSLACDALQCLSANPAELGLEATRARFQLSASASARIDELFLRALSREFAADRSVSGSTDLMADLGVRLGSFGLSYEAWSGSALNQGQWRLKFSDTFRLGYGGPLSLPGAGLEKWAWGAALEYRSGFHENSRPILLRLGLTGVLTQPGPGTVFVMISGIPLHRPGSMGAFEIEPPDLQVGMRVSMLSGAWGAVAGICQASQFAREGQIWARRNFGFEASFGHFKTGLSWFEGQVSQVLAVDFTVLKFSMSTVRRASDASPAERRFWIQVGF